MGEFSWRRSRLVNKIEIKSTEPRGNIAKKELHGSSGIAGVESRKRIIDPSRARSWRAINLARRAKKSKNKRDKLKMERNKFKKIKH